MACRRSVCVSTGSTDGVATSSDGVLASRIPMVAKHPSPWSIAAIAMGTHRPYPSAINPPVTAVNAKASEPVIRNIPNMRPRDTSSSMRSPANARLPALKPALAIPMQHCAINNTAYCCRNATVHKLSADNARAIAMIDRRRPILSDPAPQMYGATSDPACCAARSNPTAAGADPNAPK